MFLARGGLEDTARGIKATILLAASASVSWVFAKSILNASTLSASYGIVGGVAVGILASKSHRGAASGLMIVCITVSEFWAVVCRVLHRICVYSCGHISAAHPQGLQIFT